MCKKLKMKNKKNKSNRFKVILHEVSDDGAGTKIIEDTETGITYLYCYGEGGAGLTVLLDEEGEPAVDPER